jgi:hypothetical protein
MENQEEVQGIGSLDKFQDLINRKMMSSQENKLPEKVERKPKRMVLTHTESGFIAYKEETADDPLLGDSLHQFEQTNLTGSVSEHF